MSGFGWFIVVFIASIVIYSFQNNTVQEDIMFKGRVLAKKFSYVGTLAGESKEEIITAVGNPNSLSALPDGRTLLQWQETGYHIALSFKDDICEGVTHEHSSLT